MDSYFARYLSSGKPPPDSCLDVDVFPCLQEEPTAVPTAQKLNGCFRGTERLNLVVPGRRPVENFDRMIDGGFICA